MKYAVKMGSGAIIYMPTFVKTGLGFQKLVRGDLQLSFIYIYFFK
jgi:hypothetical protein